MSKIYHTPILFETIAKNGSWRLGGNAITTIGDDIGMKFKMEVNQYGKTKKEAKEKLMSFITSKGTIEAEEIFLTD